MRRPEASEGTEIFQTFQTYGTMSTSTVSLNGTNETNGRYELSKILTMVNKNIYNRDCSQDNYLQDQHILIE